MAVVNVLMAGVGGQGIILASEVLPGRGRGRAGREEVGRARDGAAGRVGVEPRAFRREGLFAADPGRGSGHSDGERGAGGAADAAVLEERRPGGAQHPAHLSAHRVPRRAALSRGDCRGGPGLGPEGDRARLPGGGAGSGQPRTATVALLGALSTIIDFPEQMWLDLLASEVPKKAVDVNLKAFKPGREKAR
ncbi:MAG: hypothetical protein MZU79_02855 [Anaerotruncus sp.]|nr:hypothetical protein [Anaerotruncus sp.]